MYSQKRKQVTIIIVTIVLLISFCIFSERIIQEFQRTEELAKKIEELGNEEFKLRLYDLVVSPATETDVYIEWWKNEEDNTYYLFLPSMNNEFVFLFNIFESLFIDDCEIFPGDEFALEEGWHQIYLENGEELWLMVMKSQNLPGLFLTTESGNMDGIRGDINHTESGSYVLYDENGKVNCSGILEEIHGRGNVSFQACDKKPLSIKMKESTAVLNLGVGKTWTLLANALDESLIRNALAMEMGKGIGMAYVPDMTYADLYVNGEYQGNYQISEKVEIGDNRVEIRNLDKEMKQINEDVAFSELPIEEIGTEEFLSLKWVTMPNMPSDISSGYLLELDMWERYESEACGFITAKNQAVVAKDPKYLNSEQLAYVSGMYKDMEDALYNPEGYNAETGLYYYDYLDMESFAQKYLVDEASKNMDASLTSFFIYLPGEDIRFHAGPLWDYDRTFGVAFERNGIDLKDPNTLFVCENIPTGQAECNILYLLCQQKEFQDLYKEIYFNSMRGVLVNMAENSVKQTAETIEASAMMDAMRWDSLECGRDIEQNQTVFWEYIETIRLFVEHRIQFLDEEWK